MSDTNAHAWAHRAAQACARWDHAEHEHNHITAGRAHIECREFGLHTVGEARAFLRAYDAQGERHERALDEAVDARNAAQQEVLRLQQRVNDLEAVNNERRGTYGDLWAAIDRMGAAVGAPTGLGTSCVKTADAVVERLQQLGSLVRGRPDYDVTPTEAVLGFAAWLTMQDGALTVGRTHDASQIAQLVETYRLAQGWEPPRKLRYPDNLKRGPDVVLHNEARSADDANAEASFTEWLASEMPAHTIIDDPKLWARRIFAQLAERPQPAAVDGFAEWLASEMPAGTVIGDPSWWARRIISRLPQPAAVGVVGAVKWSKIVGEKWISLVCDTREEAEKVHGPRVVAIVDPDAIVPLTQREPVAWDDGHCGLHYSRGRAETFSGTTPITPLYAGEPEAVGGGQ